MEYLQGNYRISRILPGSMSDFTIDCPDIAAKAKAGQFVHIRVPGFTLRRPISICEVDREQGGIRILFDVRGEGTRVMAQMKEGDLIDVMGPLGNGFALLEPQKKAVVVGGGIGVPPTPADRKALRQQRHRYPGLPGQGQDCADRRF